MIRTSVKWLKRFLLIAWCLSMLVIGMWIYSDNTTLVTLSVFGFALENQSLGLVICSMLLLGALLGLATGLMVTSGKVFVHNRRYKKASKEIERIKQAQDGTKREA